MARAALEESEEDCDADKVCPHHEYTDLYEFTCLCNFMFLTFYHHITSPQQTTQGKGKSSPKKNKAEEDSGEEDDDYHPPDADEVSSIS